MSSGKELIPSYIDCEALPELFPTHKHSAEFWEALGRAVATFAYLEHILKDAILAITSVQPIPESEVDEAFETWLKAVDKTIVASMAFLITSFEKAVQDHLDTEKKELARLVNELEKAKAYRDVICHGAWQAAPDEDGKSIPRFVKRDITAKERKALPLEDKLIFESGVDAELLNSIRISVVELSCDIINVVTEMGYKFPGSNGPGKSIV